VVRLEHEGIAGSKALAHAVGNDACVRAVPEARAPTRDRVPAGLARVVGEGEGLDQEFADGERLERVDRTRYDRLLRGLAVEQELCDRPGRGVDRDVQPLYECIEPTDVVRMLVGHEHGLDRGGIGTGEGDASEKVAGRESCVDQQRTIPALDQNRVPLGAGGESRDPHLQRVGHGMT
jgi:hypothetical protein